MKATTFSSVSELFKKTANQTIYIELSNGYYVRVVKTNLKSVANNILRNTNKCTGEIHFRSNNDVQVSFD